MVKAKSILMHTALHCFLIVSGLLTALLIDAAFDGGRLTTPILQTVNESEFYKFLTQYAFFLNSSGIDIEFREGMRESAREQYETFLNSLHYKEDCAREKTLTAGGADMCIVNGRRFDYFYLVD